MMGRGHLVVLALLLSGSSLAGELVLESFAASTEAPHGKGNLYAPAIVKHGGEFLMFFGGQGKDGHDRIHLATSPDGGKWTHQGMVFEVKGANHVNDPSVLIVEGKLCMFYTLAVSGISDVIALATSADGKIWDDQGVVLGPSNAPAWDSLLVGRPAVIHEQGEFRMWYDGRKDLPLGAPDTTAPQAADSQRFVGYATSKDGKVWQRRTEPVLGSNAGAVDVQRVGEQLVMVIESREGTRWASSKDGLACQERGLLLKKEGEREAFGHVTPFLFARDGRWELYFGAAAAVTWDRDAIARAVLPEDALRPVAK
jgi:hypothetical protein